MSTVKILGIETSCDETSAAIIQNKGNRLEILSNVISSQIPLHKKYGGVVPEVASRAHIEAIIPVISEALKKTKVKLSDIDAISVANGPGLVGSLLVGVNTAKTLSYIFKKPLVFVNHLEGHIYANFIEKTPKFPAIVLIVSGGHTMLVYMKSHMNFKVLGETLDDAAGEAFDKVAKILNIGYPGGPIIEELSKKGNPKTFDFPRAEMEGETIRDEQSFLRKLPPNLDFSFSGLKTAVLTAVKNGAKNPPSPEGYGRAGKKDISASFQEAVIDVLVKKTIWAAERMKVKSVLLSGGVAANSELRNRLKKEAQKNRFNFFAPDKILCTDNAAMIASAGYFKIKFGKYLKKTEINPNLKLK